MTRPGRRRAGKRLFSPPPAHRLPARAPIADGGNIAAAPNDMNENATTAYSARKPAVSFRERIAVKSVSLAVAVVIHIAAAFAAGSFIDARQATFDVEIAWSNEPLTGFGMMEDYAGPAYAELPEAAAADPDDDPFETAAPDQENPDIDAGAIETDDPAPEDPPDNRPAYDLSRDKKKLADVRNDVRSMPKLQGLAPGNAKLIVLIRNDRVAGSRFEASIRRLFRAFPDYRFALGTSEIDPVNDIRALLIATANPKYYAETFLAVAHDIPEDRLKTAIGQSFPTRLIWSSHAGRPLATPDSSDGRYPRSSGIYKRALYLADPNMILFLRPDVLPALQNSPIADIVKTRDEDLAQSPQNAQTMLQALGGIADSDSVSAPTLFFMLRGIENIRLGRGFPDFKPPSAVTASLSADAQPRLNLQAAFASDADAEKFVDQWPDIVSAASNIGVPGVSALLSALSLAAEGENVLVTGDLNGAMISLVLMFAANYLERNSG